jgi:RNA polymerase sigma-70 factor, ECF subfamily
MAAQGADEPDDELMARVVQRDEVAFARLLARHLGSVHRYLTRMTTRADADDLAQETFLRLWLHAASYRPGTVRLTTWLHRIAHNLAVDEKRRRGSDLRIAIEKIPPQRPLPQEQAREAEVPGAATAEPHAEAMAAETRHHLDQALVALPPNQRAALLLCQVQGLSNADAAVVLGVSVRSVESLVARARRSLRVHLQNIDIMEPQRSKPT